MAGFVFMGLQGLWQESMDTLALTLVAVAVSLVIGIPLGVWAGLSKRFEAIITPVLDFMQILPTYTYLPPLTLVFLIGPATAVIATVIYATPPVIRLTAHGIREVPANTVEAADSLGSTRRQKLLKVLLPMARRTIVRRDQPDDHGRAGHGHDRRPDRRARPGPVGAAGAGAASTSARPRNAGLAIVIMAIILDRVDDARRRSRADVAPPARPRRRRCASTAGRQSSSGAVVTAVLVYVSYTYLFAAQFPGATRPDHARRRRPSSTPATRATNWVQRTCPA